MEQTTVGVWLRESLATAKYKHLERVYRDVESTLLLYKTLVPKFEAYTYDTGQCQLLVCLHGTIPITYRSNPYYIPVAFWIPTDYPHVAPIAFVVPTSEMLVRPGQHVDTSGKCYHPCLHLWNPRNEESNILRLCTILQKIFSQNPPVYTKPNPPQNPNPPPPPPPERPIPLNQNPVLSPAINTFPPRSPTPPPLPPPPPYQPSINQNVDVNRARNYGGTATTALTPNQRYSGPTLPIQLSSPPTSVSTNTSSSPPSNQLTSILDAPSPPIDLASTHLVQNRDPEIVKLQIEVYEKIERHWSDFHGKALQEINKMMTLSEQLNNSETQVEEEKRQLVELQKRLKEKTDFLKSKSGEVDRLVEQATNMPEVSVDDIFCGTTIVYNQLFELVAEDNAIEDTIYYLGKALNNERIDLQTFMKSIRTLAREQFMRRALIDKIRRQAGLVH
ncbi:hypothetical protein G9A89_007363 [Geosiphon pyriformis]|nr:hypothetical protein G9A89_007363 [Geosiphon pyriformis]